MGKQLDEDMMKLMSITERFKYIADKKAMANSISQSKEASLEEQAKHSNWEDEWVDRDESEWDSSSDGRSKRGSTSNGDDSNEY
jgi:hypothetical protein|tara:strand:- start:351 stop:602 length:252 start_codon:yes stop_codon:yes gene_type:complete